MKDVAYTDTATRQMARLPSKVRSTVEAKIHRYAETAAGDVRALQGVPAKRLRVGDYRVVFTEDTATINVLAVAHRREVYR